MFEKFGYLPRHFKRSTKQWRRKYLPKIRNLSDWSYAADGFATQQKNVGFLKDPKFAKAWAVSERANRESWPDGVPDVRWRAHVACRAANHALNLEGDFVECGVFTGLLSVTVCEFIDFNSVDRAFYLFDTFSGLPVDALPESERVAAAAYNSSHYFDCFEIAKRNFAKYKNAHLVRGILPATLDNVPLNKIAYLSIDLNNSSSEETTIARLWPRLVPGAIVVIDDYAWPGHEAQYRMWNAFAAQANEIVMTMPTGQGILIKSR